MTEAERTKQDGTGPAGGSQEPVGQPREYEKPAVAWEQALEIEANLSLACVKVVGQGPACTAARRS